MPARLALVILAGALFHSGCQLMPHSLQPEQWWKMNRQRAMDVSDGSNPTQGFQPHTGGEVSLQLAAYDSTAAGVVAAIR